MRRWILTLVGLAALVPLASGEVLDFEDLTDGDFFLVGESRVTDGVTLTGQSYFWSGGQEYNGGTAWIDSNGYAGGSGTELGWIDNINVDFDFGEPIAEVIFNYGEHGGNVNLIVNGELANVNNFSEIDGMQVGGVDVTNTDGPPGQVYGALALSGDIQSVAIGGQEFALDNVEYTVPEPASLVLLGLAGLALRRR